MTEWKSGTFERERLSSLFRSFAPAHAVDCLESIDLERLYREGKRLLLLDVDNTLVGWKREDFSEAVLDWIRQAKEMGFDICIISNTRRLARLARIKGLLGVETVRGRFKPSRAMYRLAMIKFHCTKERTVMIGDQLLTDVFGANRAGIDAIWVRQMAAREFGPTKLNRFVEKMLTSTVYKALVLPESTAVHSLGEARARELTLIDQIVRFCVVGGSSFVIDAGLTYILMKVIHVNGQPMGVTFGSWLKETTPYWWIVSATTPDKAAAPILGGSASMVAIYNSFVWNRAWTFEAAGKDRKSAQMAKFWAVSLVGACFNGALYGWFFNLLPGGQIVRAKVFSALIVSVWNFIGMRTFAFKARKK